MENKQTANPLGTEKISKLMVRFAVPSVISILVSMLYNIVDQIFIGQGVGYLGNAATNVIMPQTTIVMAVATLLGSGCVAYVSLHMGRGESKEANKGAGTTIVATVLVGLFFTILFEIFMQPLCRFFGATVDSLPYALEYGRIIAVGFPFYAVTVAYANIFRADGRPGISMKGMLMGCIINFILDPLFIFVFHWGVKGAAYATIIGQIINAVYFIWHIFHCRTFHFDRKDFGLDFSILKGISKLGISAFIAQIENVIISAVTNNTLVYYGAQSKYGPDIPMAAFGILIKLMMIANGVSMGIITGVQPILGYNYGSRQYKRVKKVFTNTVVVSTVVLVAAFCVFQFAPEAVISLFGQESELYQEFAVKGMRIFMLLCPVLGICIVTPIFFQSIGKPVQATILSVLRQLVFFLLSILIMTYFIGVEGVLWAEPISQTLSTIMTVTMLCIYWKKIFKEDVQ